MGMIFRHSLLLPAVNVNDSSHAVTLMSTDMERIVTTLQWVLNVFPNVVQVGLGLWILHSHLGVVFVAPLFLAICKTRNKTDDIHTNDLNSVWSWSRKCWQAYSATSKRVDASNPGSGTRDHQRGQQYQGLQDVRPSTHHLRPGTRSQDYGD